MTLVNSLLFSRVHAYNACVNVYKTRHIAFRRVSIIRVFCFFFFFFNQAAVLPRVEMPWCGLEPEARRRQAAA